MRWRQQFQPTATAAALLAGLTAAADAPAFSTQAAPAAPAYDRPSSWASRPGADGAAALVPPGATPAASDPPVDVFYIHPTTLRSGTRWNQDLADAATNAWTDASAVARQASAFNACCRLFVPRYRQASTLAFGSIEGDGGRAYDLAYGDVRRAFEHYLQHDNNGRPFILAGHSQGALHLKRLLAERVDGKPLAPRLVAAYVFGIGVAEGEFGRTFAKLRPCASPEDVGCVLSWNSFVAGSDVSAYVARTARAYAARFGDAPGSAPLCTNPLTFDRNRPDAPAADSKGALPDESTTGGLPPLRPGAVAARCAGGVLMVEAAPGLGFAPLPGGSLHFHDLTLFYADVRADAVRRSAAFMREARRRATR